MLFSTYQFLFLFFPITYFFVLSFPKQSNLILLFCSLFFYSVWDIRFLPFLLGSISFNYFIGKMIEKVKFNKKKLFITGVTINLAALGLFKYSNFLLSNFSFLFKDDSLILTIGLPLGISFITFQQITYLLENYRGKDHNENFVDYALFVSFFPQLIAGPIVHYNQMMPQFMRRPSPLYLPGFLFLGVGIIKKVFIADVIAEDVNIFFDEIAPHSPDLSLFDSFFGSLGYTMQLYFDFSGYSDMAVGLGCFFGIMLPFNFNSPYKAKSISEFWRRWHMTLSEFLRDHLYIPLGGNRRGYLKTLRNLMITMLLGGLWHGAGWTFIFWGFLHGLYLVLGNISRGKFINLNRFFIYRQISMLFTFCLIIFAWIFFRAKNFEIAWNILEGFSNFKGQTQADYFFSFKDSLILILLTLATMYLPNSIDLYEFSQNAPKAVYQFFELWGRRLPFLLILNMVPLFFITVGFYSWNLDEWMYRNLPIAKSDMDGIDNKIGDLRNNFFQSKMIGGSPNKVVFVGSSFTRAGGRFEFEYNSDSYLAGSIGIGGNFINNGLRGICFLLRLKNEKISHVILGINPLNIHNYLKLQQPFIKEGVFCIEKFGGTITSDQMSWKNGLYSIEPHPLRIEDYVQIIFRLNKDKFYQFHDFLNVLKTKTFARNIDDFEEIEISDIKAQLLEVKLKAMKNRKAGPVKSDNGKNERFKWQDREIIKAVSKNGKFIEVLSEIKKVLDEREIQFFVYETPTASHKEAPFAFPKGFFEKYQQTLKRQLNSENITYLDYANIFPFNDYFMSDIFHPLSKRRKLLREKIIYDIFLKRYKNEKK